MNGKYLLMGAVLAGFVLSPTGAAVDTAGCRVTTHAAVANAEGFYASGGGELWQEANGIGGLQRSASYCADGRVIPPDLCVTHSENNALVSCSTSFALGVLG